jgi:drug/metabolite transporter (DMT)-like permease
VVNSVVLEFRGELAALFAALIWAIASVIYAGMGRSIFPLALNFAKGAIAIAIITLMLVVRDDLIPQVSLVSIGLLLVSGVIGIGLGDTAFFTALNYLGARRTLLMEALSPPLSACLALIFLGEQLKLNDWLGIALTVLGVAWVIAERTPDAVISMAQLRQGIIFGLLAALGQSCGAVLSRSALADTSISPLWSTLVRLLGGTLVLLVGLCIRRNGMQILKPLRSPRLLGLVASTSLVGTVLAIWLQQTSLKYAATGIAQSLSSTSPLFVIPIALWLGEKVSLRALLGVLIALFGIWLLF